MATNGTRTVGELATAALRRAGVVDLVETPTTAEMTEALDMLESMLKAWQPQPWMWTRGTGSLTLTTATNYTLPERYLRILNARLKRSGIETPMEELSAREYDELPQKTTTGLPTTYFYDRRTETGVLYVWPALATASGETIEYRYQREIADIAASTDVADVPSEWWEAVIYGLALRVAEAYERPEAVIGRLFQRAAALQMDASAGAMTESTYFEPDWY